MAQISLADLPCAVMAHIIAYLDWYEYEWGRLDTALLNHRNRSIYLGALSITELKVEKNGFWDRILRKGILNWIIARNIVVKSWGNNLILKEDMRAITNGLPQLQSLHISGCWMVDHEGMKDIVKLTQLQSLELACCHGFMDDSMEAIASGLPQLQYLNISYCEYIYDDGVKAMANGLSQLQSLDMTGCKNITIEGIKAISNSLHQLQSLNITKLNELKLGNNGIEAIANGLPQLKSLNITECKLISDLGIDAIARMSQLQFLSIRECTLVTDRGLEAIARLSELRSLNISFCVNISDVGIKDIATGLPRLELLDVYACRRISDEGLKAIARLSKLQSLNISYCSNVTDTGMEAILSGLSHLRFLNFHDCERISSEMGTLARNRFEWIMY